MTQNSEKANDVYPADEAKARFEATLRGALKTPPHPASSKKKAEVDKSRASAASAKTVRPEA